MHRRRYFKARTHTTTHTAYTRARPCPLRTHTSPVHPTRRHTHAYTLVLVFFYQSLKHSGRTRTNAGRNRVIEMYVLSRTRHSLFVKQVLIDSKKEYTTRAAHLGFHALPSVPSAAQSTQQPTRGRSLARLRRTRHDLVEWSGEKMSFCAARIADDNAGEQLTRTLEAAKCDDREEDDGREHREEGRGAQLTQGRRGGLRPCIPLREQRQKTNPRKLTPASETHLDGKLHTRRGSKQAQTQTTHWQENRILRTWKVGTWPCFVSFLRQLYTY